MKLIVFSSEIDIDDELKIIQTMFDNGLERFHLRKPYYSFQDYVFWINSLNREHRNKIVVHSNEMKLLDLEVGGLHAKSTFSLNEASFISKSCHSLKELMESQNVEEYLFLSPIFNSISKRGYMSAFKPEGLEMFFNEYNGKPVFALGGVTINNVESCKEIGFKGIAVLGSIWNSKSPINSFINLYKKCQN